ncbi:7701_t:CDS:2, partial [Cetraspora pellucida]
MQPVKIMNIEEKFLIIISNIVNIIDVALSELTKYDVHINNEIICRITMVITVIRSLKSDDEYGEFLHCQNVKTMQIFLFNLQKMMKFINKDISESMMEFEDFINFTIKIKTHSKKKKSRKNKYNKYFKDINKCHNITSRIIYPIERDEANQLFGVIL